MVDNEEQPLVTFITPVYNTEKYLPDCIRGVLAQTYENWEYVIVNNRSADRSGEIAARFARTDGRIRVVENDRFLSQMENWNHAMRQISAESRYCKVVHADDWLFPECVQEMVAAAEAHPNAGMVGSYRLDETRVNLDGLPWPSPVTNGRELCRRHLLENIYIFGSPTSTLIRSDIVRKRDPFYDETFIHADKAICFEILKEWDFAFLHKILTFTRRHNESTTTFIHRFDTAVSARLEILLRYGPAFLTRQEYQDRLKRMVNGYHSFLARSLLTGRGREFIDYHRNALKKMGVPLRPLRFLQALLMESLNLADLFRGLRNRRRSGGADEILHDRGFENTIVRGGS
jgi:glycosyltransferase involved in cell wall biosynthesis